MKVTPNRSAAISYAVLATLPIGLELILFQGQSWGTLWAARHTIMNPIIMVALSLGALTLSILCFPNRVRSQRFKLYLLCASLLLVALWTIAMPWLPLAPMFLYVIPSWSLWRSYRESSNTGHAA